MPVVPTPRDVASALQRARWLHYGLILLVLLLAVGSLRLGLRMQSVRRELRGFQRAALVGDLRRLRQERTNGWTERFAQELEEARHIRADLDLRNEAIQALARDPRVGGNPPSPPPHIWQGGILQRRDAGPLKAVAFDDTGPEIVAFFERQQVLFPRVGPRLGRPANRLRTEPENPRVATSPDGRVVARITDSGDLILEAGLKGPEVARLPILDPAVARSVAWSQDGRHVAVAYETIPPGNPAFRPLGLGVWDLPQLRAGLARWDLDWPDAAPAMPPRTPPDPDRWGRQFRVLGGAILVLSLTTWALINQRRLVRMHAAAELAAAQRLEELDRARSTLAHAEKMRALGTLAAGVAHDLNNLLSVVHMSRQLVERQLPPDAPAREQLANIHLAVEQGRGLVRGILGYSRDTLIVTRSLKPAEVTEDVLGLLRTQFLPGLDVTTDFPPDTHPVYVSRARLEQILINLVVNAAEALGGHGRLSVRGLRTAADALPDGLLLAPRHPGPWVRLEVVDTGPGIPKDVLPRIFEPFFTTKNLGNQRGTGLGLATVWRLAGEEGLGLHVQTQPGTGTRFSLWLPMQPPPTPAKTPDPEPREPSAPATPSGLT